MEGFPLLKTCIKKISFTIIFFLLSGLLPQYVAAFVPPRPELMDNPEIKARFIEASAKYNHSKIKKSPVFASFNYPAAVDSHPICVIMLQFTDKPHNSFYTSSNFNDRIFNLSTSSLSKYMQESSYGKFYLAGTSADVYGWFTSSHTMSYYGANIGSGIDNRYTDINEMIKEAIQLADGSIDFSKYDYNKDGIVDHLIVIHSGNDEAYTGSSNDIWSHNWFINGDNPAFYPTADNSSYSSNGKVNIVSYSTFAENSSLGIMAHEFSHDLGLMDFYKTDGSGASVVGKWDVMDYGLWINDGNSPCLHSAYNKIQLGWINPVTVQPSSPLIGYRLSAIQDTPVVVKVPHPSASNPAAEYYLISNTQKKGSDYYLPGDGILVWHIDDAMGSNSENDVQNYSHPRVTLVPQDNTSPSIDRGSSGDPWKNNSNGLTALSSPNNAAYNGSTYSQPIISSIGASGNIMTLNVMISPVASDSLYFHGVSNFYNKTLSLSWYFDPNFTGSGAISYYKTYLRNINDNSNISIHTSVSATLTVSSLSYNLLSVQTVGYDAAGNTIVLTKPYIFTDTYGYQKSNYTLTSTSLSINVPANMTLTQNSINDYTGASKNYFVLSNLKDTSAIISVTSNPGDTMNIKAQKQNGSNLYVNVSLKQKGNIFINSPDTQSGIFAGLALSSDYMMNSLVNISLSNESNAAVSTEFSRFFDSIYITLQDTSITDIRNYSIKYYDNVDAQWKSIPTLYFDTANKIITSAVNHLTTFVLAYSSILSTDEYKLLIYPNPYTTGLNSSGKIKFGLYKSNISNPSLNDIYSIPVNSSVSIYTVDGTLVKNFTADSSGAFWDLRNKNGYEVSSGVYLVNIKISGSGDVTGKIGIAR